MPPEPLTKNIIKTNLNLMVFIQEILSLKKCIWSVYDKSS